MLGAMDMIAIKKEVGLNRKLTISYGSVWAAVTTLCFLLEIGGAASLVKLIFSVEFLFLIFKTSVFLLPVHSAYMILLSNADKRIKMTCVISNSLIVTILLGVNFYYDNFIVNWWLDHAAIQSLLLSMSVVLFVGIFEVKIGNKYYSLFYNQKHGLAGTGWLTIITENGKVTNLLGLGFGFAGKLPISPNKVN